MAPSHLDYSLDGFPFRFHRRRSRARGLLFYRLVGPAVALDPVRVQTLVGGRMQSEPQGVVVT